MTRTSASPASSFSQNIERAKSLASRIETGAVWINTFASTAPELPLVESSALAMVVSFLNLASRSS